MTNVVEYSWKRKFLLAMAVFVVLLAAAYFPKLNQSGFLQDDWNTLFVTENRGAGELVFHYSLDRPLRGYFSLLENRLLGVNRPAYVITSLLWRLLDTAALYLILMLIWPGKWKTNVLICALALIYPGFHEQQNVFEYQAHLFARMCVSFSILLSLFSYKSKKWFIKLFSLAAAILLAQVTFGLMEYYIGIEGLRLAFFIALFMQQQRPRKWIQTLIYEAIFVINAGFFLFWRLFIFEEKRASVDAGSMLSGYGSFGTKLLEDLSAMGVNLYRLIISAFYKPLVVFGQHVDQEDWLIGIGIAILAVLFIVLVTSRFLRNDDNGALDRQKNYPVILIFVGLMGSIGALAPVIFGGREITYIVTGDRFSYPSLISACIFFIGLIWLIKPRGVRLGLVAVLVFLSVLTQFTNNIVFAKNGEQTNAVWWQMSWRAPQLEPQTILSGNIYLGMLDEDYTLWGPANIIYYPESRDITITAEVLAVNTQNLFTTQGIYIAERKGIAYMRDFGNLLLLSKSENACLHIIDGLHPEYSQGDTELIRETGPWSQLERIEVDSAYNPQPRMDLFGAEPARDWCYFYQNAQLERQRRDWKATANYGDEALAAGYVPQDAMEWLVILQAYAYTDNVNYGDVLQELLEDEYASGQVCQVFSSYTEEIAQTGFSDAHQKLLMDVCRADE